MGNNSVYRARSDFGLVNIWLNVVKLLIGLVFAYQQILTEQLRTDLLTLTFNVLTLESSNGVSHGSQPQDVKLQGNAGAQQGPPVSIPSTLRSQVVNDPDYRFFIPFVPLSREKYLRGKIEVTAIEDNNIGSQLKIRRETDTIAQRFNWPGEESGAGNKPMSGSIVVGEFSLKNILDNIEDLESKDSSRSLKVYFRIVLYSDDESKMMSGQWPPNDDPTFQNWVRLEYKPPQKTEPYGPLPIVLGQYCDFPYQLKGKMLVDPDGPGRIRRQGALLGLDKAEILIENDYKVGGEKIGRFHAKLLSYDREKWEQNIYEINIAYNDDKNVPRHRVVTFIAQDNVKPRPIFPREENKVQIYYPDDRYESPYSYFDLDKFIVDPDGLDEGVPPKGGLRPKKIIPLQRNSNYEVVGSKQEFWRLKIKDESEVRNEEIKLQVYDDYDSKGVTITLVITVR